METKPLPLLARRGRQHGSVVAYALVDADDYARVSQCAWYWWPKKRSSSGYAVRWESPKTGTRPLLILLHREILGLPRGDARTADHINRNGLDCRKDNLRVLTLAHNMQNQPAYRSGRSKAGSARSSRYRGVHWDRKARRWCAEVRLDRKRVFRGWFDDEEAAAVAASEARLRFMPFAVEATGGP